MILFGGDFNPFQWPEKLLDEDVGLMREAGVSLVTVGVFDWSRLEPAPGEFDFERLDQVLDRLHDAGIGVCLATPTASPPPWLTREHPDVLPVGADGVRLSPGSRDTYCVSSPAYRRASVRIARELADRYARHGALRLWHVHNEYGTRCHCDLCAEAFRVFLSARHHDVETLNEAWTTDFWSQRYRDFGEVLPPRATQYLHNPAQLLDYRRFVSDALLGHYRAQRDVLRAAGPAPVTTNFAIGDWVPVDHARWAREVDVVAIDDYPPTLGDRAFDADLARGWALAAGHDHGRWMLMEHAPGPDAAEVAQVYLDRGATGILYFQWRASPGGAEQWHPAMVPLLDELRPLGLRLRHEEVRRVRATRALIFDEETMWAWQSPHLPFPVDYLAVCRGWHAALREPVDVLPVSAALDGYETVVAPALHLLSPESHAALRAYVGHGGTLVIGPGSAMVDDRTRSTPGALDDLAGGRIDWHGITVSGATVLRRDDDGRALVTEHRYGRGVARFVAAPEFLP